MNVRLGLAIAVALQSLALMAMVGMKQWTLSTGTPIVLELRPIDPRSLFRGDYVRLQYAINGLAPNLPGMPDVIQPHDTLYVTLRQDGDYWKPTAVHTTRPEPSAGEVVIKGEAPYGARKQFRTRTVIVRYGIEEYFVPEGEGRRIERVPRGSKVSVVVAVDSNGDAAIKALQVDGKIRYEEKLF